jgi:hypothetical protein
MGDALKSGFAELRLAGRSWRLDLVLLAILVLAAGWRVNGLDWGWTDFDPAAPDATGPGRFHAFHPDEASNIRAARLFTESDSWRPTGELYGEQVDYSLYGATTIYLHVAVVKARALLGDIRPFDEEDPRSFRATWLAVRWLTALLGLACIPMLYWAALTLHGLPAARLAALLLAGAAFHAQSGRFGTVDMPMVFFTLWSFAHSARLLRAPGRLDLALAALAAGLAVSTKVNAVLVVLPLILAELLRDPLPAGPGPAGRILLRRLFSLRLLGAGAGVVAIFFALNPYAILDWRSYLFADHAFGLVHILRNVRGDFFYPFQIQFEHVLPFPFLIGKVLWWAAGPALLLAGLAALPWMAWRRRRADWLVLIWLLPGLLLTGGAKVLFMRYALPFLPLLALTAAVGLSDLLAWASRRGRGATAAAWALAAAVALPSLGWTAALASVHDREDSRIAAGRWLAARLPAGAALLHERSANTIKTVIHMPRYRNVCLEIPTIHRATGATEGEKLDFLVDRLRQVEWAAILESNRKLGYERNGRYRAELRFYQELFAGRLGFATDTVFQTLPTVLGLAIDDEPAEFSLRYYDHEEIHILRRVDAAALDERLAALKGEFATDPATVDGRLARAAALLEQGDLHGARAAVVRVLDEGNEQLARGGNGAFGSSAAFGLLAVIFEASALRAVEANDASQATQLVKETDRLHSMAVQAPTTPLARSERMADWVRFRARALGAAEALGLLEQAFQSGLDGPGLREAAEGLGAGHLVARPPRPTDQGEEP